MQLYYNLYLFLRPRNALNIRLAAISLNPVLRLFGVKYRIENAKVLDEDGPCIIVANHQSSLDFIGMMHIWPEHVRYCTILAKKELIWAGPFGSSSWLAGVEFIDRKNREQSSETMRHILKKITNINHFDYGYFLKVTYNNSLLFIYVFF